MGAELQKCRKTVRQISQRQGTAQKVKQKIQSMREKVCVAVKEKQSARSNDCLTSAPVAETREKHTLGHPDRKLQGGTPRPQTRQNLPPPGALGSPQVTDSPAQEGRREAGQSEGSPMLRGNTLELSLPGLRRCLFHSVDSLYS